MLSNCGRNYDMTHVAYSNVCSTSITHRVTRDSLIIKIKNKSEANFRAVTIFLFKHFSKKESQGLIT